MALIIRLDVDRPYGRHPLARHLLSRVSSDLYLPRVTAFGFLAELRAMLTLLNEARSRAYVFFRRCTLPSRSVLDLLDAGRHEIGLHLEDSRSFATFLKEKDILERQFGRKVRAVSKHGSGGARFGYHHYAPYEPDKYIAWARQCSMRLFLGNLQDPSLPARKWGDGLLSFPSAFWLEPPWRDTSRFPTDWLQNFAQHQDVVLLVHPENVLANPDLTAEFKQLITTLESRIY